jgi:hypothetical protein
MYLAAGLPVLLRVSSHVYAKPLFSFANRANGVTDSSSRSRMREHYAEIVASCAWVDLFLRELDLRVCLSFAWQSV